MPNDVTAKEPLEQLILKNGVIMLKKGKKPVKAVAVGAPVLMSHEVPSGSEADFPSDSVDGFEQLCDYKPKSANAFLVGETTTEGGPSFGSQSYDNAETAVQYFRI